MISLTVSAANASSIHARAACSLDARRRLVEEQHELGRIARICARLERLAQPVEVCRGDEVVGESGVDRIRGVHDLAREARGTRRGGPEPATAATSRRRRG